MSSFDISSAGLQAQAAAIQVTSNNVANASTVGYKARESLFVDQYFKAVQSSGVAGAADFGAKRVDTQGALKGSASALDLAVQGQGMFRLSSQVSGDTANNYYSRNGSFSVDKDGYIVNANGLFLTGYQPNDTLTGVTTTLAGLKVPPSGIAPVASTAGNLVANLDTRVAEPLLVVGGVTTATPNTFRATDTDTFNHSTTVQVYDSKGLAHEVSLFFKKVDPTVVEDPRSLSTPKASATAVQYEVYMLADGVTMAATDAGNSGAATLGNAATTAAAQAKALADAYDLAAAASDDAARTYNVATASYTSSVSAQTAALGSLAAVRPSALLSQASPETAAVVTAASALVTANTDLSEKVAALGKLEDAQASADAALAAASSLDATTYATLTLAAATAATAVSTYEGGDYAAAVLAQASAATSFDTALTAYAALTVAVTDPDAAVGVAAIAKYATATTNVATAEATVATALAAKDVADAEAVATAAANSAAVAKTRVATLQFVDGKLLGSLTQVAGTGKPTSPMTVNADLADSNGIPLFSVALDLSDMTSFGSAFQVTKNSADGYAAGALADMSIDETGQITGQYTNGMSLIAGQLVLATFQSPDGLDPASGSVFSETYASGEPVLGIGTNSSFGAVRSRMLEQSTTDMAAELVNLMVQQRNYQANSQGLQAANTVLTTAINLGR
ncbi:MAG: flagellar hook-basal body complex protein [Aquabacterium sp.]|nr:flagellar hook-basal body complex protein [Aquabacterium sp.]